MTYQDGMVFLSQCRLGAVLISEKYEILELNEKGNRPRPHLLNKISKV